MSQDDKVWGQPCGQHCVYSTLEGNPDVTPLLETGGILN